MAERAVAGPAGWLRERWDRADRMLGTERRDFWLNLAFFEGHQWVWWHKTRREVVDFFDTSSNDDRVRATINVIQSNLINTLAKLTKRNLAFEVLPSGVGDDARAGARLGESVLEASRIDQAWEEVRYEELFNAFLGGTSAVLVEWDGQAGDRLGVDDTTGQVIGTGEVKLTALSLPEFTLEPGSRRARDARWCIVAKALPPAQVQEQFRLAKPPEADTTNGQSPLLRRRFDPGNHGSPSENLTTVLTYYERPTPSNEKGRMLTVVGEEVVDDRPWPFPWKDRLNIVVFRQQPLPMRWTGRTFVTDARPLQVMYNLGRSTIGEHMKKTAAAKLLYPDTVPEYIDGLDDDPGKPMPYDATNRALPQWMSPPDLGRWLTQDPDRVRGELDDLMHNHAISRGEAPGDRNSGLALSVLAEKDESPLGIMAHDQSHGWGQIASLVLELYASKVTETRTARTMTEDRTPVEVEWNGDKLRGQTRATVPLDNVMPHNRAAMQAWVTTLAQSFPVVGQAIDGPLLAKLIDMPGAEFLTTIVDADVARAQRENHLMSSNVTCLPEKFDDHGKHIAEHNRARKGVQYENAPPEVRELFDLHIQAHEGLVAAEVQSQQQMNAGLPGAAALPQGNEPIGSAVPADFAEQQAMRALGPGAPPGSPPPGMAG